MALGTVTVVSKDVKAAGEAVYADEITVVGDGAYPTGGSAGLEAAFRAKVGDNREILAVMDAGLNGGYVSRYDKDSGKLLVLTSNGAAPAGLAEFTNAGDLSGTTFRYLVLSR